MVTMPSASSKSSVQPINTEAGDPWNQALLIVEKKVRNLEKRKGKLDSYKKLVDDGKELNEDQKTAVGQRDAVEKLLEFSKELQRQFIQLNTEFLKSQKKQAKRDLIIEQAAKHNSNTNLVKKILELQQLLDSITEEAKADFLAGTNGAVQLTEADLNNIDEFYKLITPSDDEEEPQTQVNLETASEHIVYLFDASNKEFKGTTYKALYEVITKIQNCGYFGQQPPSKEVVETPEEAENVETESSSSGQEQTPNSVEESAEVPLEQESPSTPEETLVEPNVNGLNGDETTPDHLPEVTIPEQASDVMALATNELGLNFLGESEVEAAPVEMTGQSTVMIEADVEKPVDTEEQIDDDSGWTQTGTNGDDSQQDQGSTQRGGRGGGGWRGGRPPRGSGYRGRGGRGGNRGGGPQVNGTRQEGGFRRGGGMPGGRGGSRGGPRGGPRGGANPNRRGGFGGPSANKQ